MDNGYIWLLDAHGRKIMARGTYLYLAALSFIFAFNRTLYRAAPVVIDSVLARLTQQERMRMIDTLPKFSEQVIAMFRDSEIGEGSIKSRISSLSSRARNKQRTLQSCRL